MKTLKELFFSLMSLNLITKNILDFLTAAVANAQCSTKKPIESNRHISIFSFIILNYVPKVL